MFYSNDTLSHTSKEDRNLLIRVRDLLWNAADAIRTAKKIPGNKKNYLYRCHSIARALLLEIGDESVKCVDGFCVGAQTSDTSEHVSVTGHPHSWLVTGNGSIIDPFPIGTVSFGPLLLPATGLDRNCAYGRYRPNLEIVKEIVNRRTWRQARVIHGLFKAAA